MSEERLRSFGHSVPSERTAGKLANEEGLSALGDQLRHTSSGVSGPTAGTKKRSRGLRILVVALVVLLMVVAGAAGYTYYLTHSLNRVQVRGLSGALTTGQEAGAENILMVGSTNRCALKVQNPAYGICSQGITGVNSDVIMILHADPIHHHLALLSIPRDL